MKITSLIAGAILVASLASCSAAYKTDQTVDDVYYSPGKPAGGDEAKQDNGSQNDYSYNKEDDNYLRMMVQNRSRWSAIDDYAYWNSYNTTSYGLSLGFSNFGYSNYYNNYWNNGYNNYGYNPYLSYGLGYNTYGYGYYGYNNYNPYYGYNNGYNYYNPGVYIKNTSSTNRYQPSTGAYLNHTFSNQNYNSSNHNFVNGNTPQTGVGRLLRTIVSGGTNTNDSYNPARTFSNSRTYSNFSSPSTNTSSPSSSSSSSAPAAASSRSSATSSGGGRRN